MNQPLQPETRNPKLETLPLRRLAENLRHRAAAIEAKHGKLTWVQVINVIEAFEQCAGDLETFLNETLETRPQEPAHPQDPLRPVAPAQTSNPS